MSYLKSAPSILPYCKVWCKNKKSLNLGPKMRDMCIFVLELKILLSYLKLVSSNLPCFKIWFKNKNLYILDQKRLIWVFLSWSFKKPLSYFRLAPSNLSKTESFTNTVKFVLVSAFFKGPESRFWLGPDPGPLQFIKYALYYHLLVSL